MRRTASIPSHFPEGNNFHASSIPFTVNSANSALSLRGQVRGTPARCKTESPAAWDSTPSEATIVCKYPIAGGGLSLAALDTLEVLDAVDAPDQPQVVQ
jgi:hypothetical protein